MIDKELVIKLAKEGVPTSEIAKNVGYGVRYIQQILKNNGLNRSLEKAKQIEYKRRKQIDRGEVEKLIVNKKIKYIKVEEREENLKYKYCLYRFLNKKGEVLYLGKCSRSDKSKWGHKYFLSDRIRIHFTKRQSMPNCILNSITKLEYCFFEEDISMLELNLILLYKYRKECIWNGQMIYEFTMDIPNIEWKEFEHLDRFRKFL